MTTRSYHPDDVAGKFNPAIEEFYQSRIDQAPQDSWGYWCLIQLHLTHGRGLSAIEVFKKAVQAFPDPPWIIVKFYWRVIYAFLDTASYSNLHEELFSSVPEQFRDYKTHQGLLRLRFQHEAVEREQAVVPATHLHNDWWKEGPIVLEKEGLNKYLAMYVTHIDGPDYGEKAQFCAKVGFIDVKTSQIQFGWFYHDVANLTEFMPESELRENKNWFMEMGEYEDGKSVLMTLPRKPFDRGEWEANLGLRGLKSELDGLRYLRNWGAVR